MLTDDRRTRRSKRMLGEALLALMQEKNYNAITIRDITDRADVGYMTFYRHYENKDALLVTQIQTMVEEAIIDSTHDFREVGLIVFRFAEQHPSLMRLVLCNDALSIARAWIRERIANNLLQAPKLFPSNSHPFITKEMAANHIASSVLNLIAWWLDNQSAYSPEHMGKVYQQMILEPTLKTLTQGEINQEWA